MTTALTRQDGTLREDGALVIKRIEQPNGWQETHKVGVVKIRGEHEPRTINYADYAKLLTFYAGQAKMVKDRKHVMVALSGGVFINTADITSLELAEQDHFTPKTAEVSENIRKLPTEELLLDLDGMILAKPVTMRSAMEKAGDKFRVAKCHYYEEPGGFKRYLTELKNIPEALEYRKSDEPNYPPILTQAYKYGIPQL